MLSTLILVGLAQAAEPQTTVTEDGLTVRYFVPHDVALVRTVLDDTNKVYEMSDDLVSFSVDVQGRCDSVTTEAPGLLSNLRMRTERCQLSDTTWRDRLVSSDDFDSYEVLWTLTEVKGGTIITYHLEAELSFPVPDKVMYQRAGEAAVTQLENIYGALETFSE